MPDLNRQFERAAIVVPDSEAPAAWRAVGRLHGFQEGKARGFEAGWKASDDMERRAERELSPGLFCITAGFGASLAYSLPDAGPLAAVALTGAGAVWFLIGMWRMRRRG